MVKYGCQLVIPNIVSIGVVDSYTSFVMVMKCYIALLLSRDKIVFCNLSHFLNDESKHTLELHRLFDGCF